MKVWKLLLIVGLIGFIPTFSHCQTISFQGVLQRGGEPLPDGQYLITFRIYDQSEGGDPLWTESQSVTTTRGLYQVRLGSVEQLQPALDFTKPYWISVQLPDEVEMGRLPIQYGPYCFNTLNLGGKPAESFQTPVIRQQFSYVDEIDVGTDWQEITSVTIMADSASTLSCEARWRKGQDRIADGMQLNLADQDGNVIDNGEGSFNNPYAMENTNQTFWTFSVDPGTYIVVLFGVALSNTTFQHPMLSVTCIPDQPDDQRNLQAIKFHQSDFPQIFNKR
jgi:hypothetical protein